MTQPDGPDRAARHQARDDKLVAQLRHASSSFEPDGERIRRLVDLRIAQQAEPRAAERRRGLPGRAVLWPAVGSAAAAAVIFAVAAAGAGPPDDQPSPGADPAARPSPSLTVAEPLPPTVSAPLPPPTSTTVDASPTAGVTPGATPGITPGGTAGVTPDPGPTSLPSGAPAPAASRGAAAVSVPPAPPASSVMQAQQQVATLGPHVVTVTIQQVTASAAGAATAPQPVAVGATGEFFRVTNASADQPHTTGDLLGNVHALGQGLTAGPGPYRVTWQNGSGGTPAGSSTTWITVPGAASGDGAGLRLPVRFRHVPTTVTLYLGTTGGTGRLQLTTPGGPASVALPACSQTCTSVVTVSLAPVAGVSAPTTGDVTIDLFALGAGARIGLAAAVLR